MFETLYKDPATIAKYRRAPLLEERERYLRVVGALGAVGEVVLERSRGFLGEFPAPWLSLAAFPWLAERAGPGRPSARPTGRGLRGLDAG